MYNITVDKTGVYEYVVVSLSGETAANGFGVYLTRREGNRNCVVLIGTDLLKSQFGSVQLTVLSHYKTLKKLPNVTYANVLNHQSDSILRRA
jgi:hypothetical protein